MYTTHFGLHQAPFSITPNPAFFYSGNSRGEMLDALLYAVEHGEGIVKVTGEVGSGKTMLCRMLESELPEHIDAIYLVNPSLGPQEVLYAIAAELGLDPGGRRNDEVLRQLNGELIKRHGEGRQVVLLVEEAQAMPLDTLEQVRLLTNLETAQHKLLQIVLFGQPELNMHLEQDSIRQLAQRITFHYHLGPLNKDDLEYYLAHRLRVAGFTGGRLFGRGAVSQLYAASGGIPRLINILAHKALMLAYGEGKQEVSKRHVAIAAQDTVATRSSRLPWLIGGLSLLVAACSVTWALTK